MSNFYKLSQITTLIIILSISSCYENKSIKEDNSKDVSDTKSNRTEAVKNTCTICNRQFEGTGYEEVSDGVWEPCKYPFQCFICSPACGMKHTNKMNKLMEDVGVSSKNSNIDNLESYLSKTTFSLDGNGSVRFQSNGEFTIKGGRATLLGSFTVSGNQVNISGLQAVDGMYDASNNRASSGIATLQSNGSLSLILSDG